MKMSENDFEILEPTDYTGKTDESYSHPSLLMSALKRASENRAKEMRDGYYNTKFDRLGNAHKVWVPDSREEFIESVKALMMIQERDFDMEGAAEIKEILDDLEERYKKYCDMEEEMWNNFDSEIVDNLNKQGYSFMKGKLSQGLPFKYEYLRDEVEAYTRIYSAIQKLIKRIGEYGEVIYES